MHLSQKELRLFLENVPFFDFEWVIEQCNQGGMVKEASIWSSPVKRDPNLGRHGFHTLEAAENPEVHEGTALLIAV
jgi:hypothetical protein